MYGVKEIGKYNVDYAGRSYAGNIPYNMVIFEAFDGNKPVEGSRKRLYFLATAGCITPSFDTELEIESFLKLPNNTKIKVWEKIEIVVENIEGE